MVITYVAKVSIGNKVETFESKDLAAFKKVVEKLYETFPNREVYLFVVESEE